MENKREEITISKKFLDDTITQCSKRLVGLVMRRFEILEDKEAIKASVKELIYENGRFFKEIVNSFSFGIKFVAKKPKNNSKKEL